MAASVSTRGVDFLRALEVFLAVADCRSMTTAARSLGITQSAVSQILGQLEIELDKTLFDRTVRPLALTTAGAVLRSRATQLVTDAAETRTLVRSIGRGAMPQLRLAVIGSLAGTLVPPLVAALTERLPVRDISVWRGLATTQENALINRDVDMLVTSDPLYDMEGLERFLLFREPFIVIAPPGTLRRRGGVTLARLAEHMTFIRYTRRTQIGAAIESQLSRLRAVVPGTVAFDSSEDVIAMVAAGGGWAITAPSHVLHGLRTGASVDTAAFPGPAFRRSVNLVVRAAELGGVPQEVHRLCIDVLRRDFLPRLRKVVPWLDKQFEIAAPAKAGSA